MYGFVPTLFRFKVVRDVGAGQNASETCNGASKP
jgi:hypothetical protein